MSETNTVVRAVTMPVCVPLGCDPTGEPWTWQSFGRAMDSAFRVVTDLANWCVRELYLREPNPFPRDGRFPAFPSFGPGGLYRHAFGNLARGESGAYPRSGEWRDVRGVMKNAATLIHNHIEKRYKAQRFDLLRRGDVSLLRFRHPFPYPVHNQEWESGYADGDFPTVRLTIPHAGTVELRLKRRADFRRQLVMFRQLHDGTAAKGEAALYRDRKGLLLLKLVGHFPRREPGERVHACTLRTDPNALLVAEIDGRSPWILNCDHTRRWQAEHRRYLQRTAEDLKREKRLSPGQRRNLNKARAERCGKHNDRLDTFCHQISAQVAKFCDRQRVAVVNYDDENKAYIPDGFPWHKLKERLRVKLDAMGVALVAKGVPLDKESVACRLSTKTAAALSLSGRRLAAGKNRKPGQSHPAVSAPSATSSSSTSTRSKT